MDRDRRWFERVPVTGAAAAVLDCGYLGLVYELQDLSLGGARLRGKRRPPDESFEVLMHISNRFLERRARQVWFEDQGELGALGIEFEGLDVRDTLDWADQHNEETLNCQTLASLPLNRSALLVLDRRSAHAAQFSRSLLALGLDPVMASTPLEAINLMNRKRSEIEIVFIAPEIPGCTGGDFAAFVADTFPAVRRVLLDGGDGQHGSMPGPERVLAKPWSLASIKATLESFGLNYTSRASGSVLIGGRYALV